MLATLASLIVALLFFCFCEYVYSDRQRPALSEVLSTNVPQRISYFVSYFRQEIFIAAVGHLVRLRSFPNKDMQTLKYSIEEKIVYRF